MTAPDASTSPVGHTPGPWIESGDSDWYPDRHEGTGDTVRTVIRSDAASVDVAIVMEAGRHWSDAKALDANARLIAAAPELLAVAIRMIDFARSGAHFFYPLGSLQELEQAVAKARGTTPAPEVSHVG